MESKVPDHAQHCTAAVDAELVRRCRNGDREAQRNLYDLTHRRVYGLMVRIAGLEAAEDLTQQVYLKVFRKLSQFSGQSSFETWLYRLSTNEALQHLRKDRRNAIQSLAHEPEAPVERANELAACRELLELGIARLDPDLRVVFILKEIEQLPYQRIAEVLEIAEGTVGSRLNTARKELQRHLIQLGWEV